MGGEEWRGDSPVGLLNDGREFIKVGHDALCCHRKRQKKLLGPSQEPPLDLQGEIAPFAIYYNFLHGVELGLKAYLRHVDAVTLKNLKSRRFGHNLASLLDEALKHGLCSQCPELTVTNLAVIRSLSPIYADKQFEYIRIGGVQLEPVAQVAEAAETLIAELKKLRMKAASAG